MKKLTKIARHEGVSSLWQGTNVQVMLAVPLVAIYLPLYDVFSAQLEPMHMGFVTPLAAGPSPFCPVHQNFCSVDSWFSRERLDYRGWK